MSGNNAASEFNGIHADMYRFFWEIAFHNEESFYRENYERYISEVKRPLYGLAAGLLPTAQKMDENFSTRLSQIVSKIRKDTRYSHDGAPFRDHAWISFRYPGYAVSMSFTPYVEFNRDSWGYGMGMYAPDTEMMNHIRQRILSAPEEFKALLAKKEFKRFKPGGVAYKKKKYTDPDCVIEKYLNLRSLYFSFSSNDLSLTIDPGILDLCTEALQAMTPMYRFIMK